MGLCECTARAAATRVGRCGVGRRVSAGLSAAVVIRFDGQSEPMTGPRRCWEGDRAVIASYLRIALFGQPPQVSAAPGNLAPSRRSDIHTHSIALYVWPLSGTTDKRFMNWSLAAVESVENPLYANSISPDPSRSMGRSAMASFTAFRRGFGNIGH